MTGDERTMEVAYDEDDAHRALLYGGRRDGEGTADVRSAAYSHADAGAGNGTEKSKRRAEVT
jgi:hypothetical protein